MGTSNSVLTPEEVKTVKANIKKFIDENKCEDGNGEKYKRQIEEIYKANIKQLENDEEFSESYKELLECYQRLKTSIPRPSPLEEIINIETYFKEFEDMYRKAYREALPDDPKNIFYGTMSLLKNLQYFDYFDNIDELDNIDKLKVLKTLKYFMMFILEKPDLINEAKEKFILETNIDRINAKINSFKQGFKKFKSTRKSKKSNKKIKKSQKSYRKVKKSVKSIKKRNIKH